jgi:shikimate kinase
MPRLTLIGYRGSGKSTVAARVAERLGCSWVDADDVFEREAGVTIANFLATHGEPAFRDLEATLLEHLLATETGVLATGGGVVLRESNRELLRHHGPPVVWLDAPAAVLRGRLAADPATSLRRPALAGNNVLDEVAAAVTAREPLYRSTSDGVLDVTSAFPDELADRLVRWLEHRVTNCRQELPEQIS